MSLCKQHDAWKTKEMVKRRAQGAIMAFVDELKAMAGYGRER